MYRTYVFTVTYEECSAVLRAAAISEFIVLKLQYGGLALFQKIRFPKLLCQNLKAVNFGVM